MTLATVLPILQMVIYPIMFLTFGLWIAGMVMQKNGNTKRLRTILTISMICYPVLVVGFTAHGLLTKSPFDILIAGLSVYNFVTVRRQLGSGSRK